MTQIETLKAQAQNLKHAMNKMGVTISLAQALEAIAGQYGMENWDTLAGLVKASAKAEAAVTLVDQLARVHQIELKGCSGQKKFCSVLYLDKDALAYVQDEVRLQKYVSENSKKYPTGLKCIGMRLRDASGDYQFSLAELVGIKCDKEYWYLASGLVAMRFHRDEDPVEGLTQVELAIPQRVKSAKGCRLVVLCSHDGAHYDRHVIVPPHLDVETISAKLAVEIRRLKEIERALEEDGDYDGYTEEDIARYAGSIGCLWVGKPVVVSENWD